MKKLTAAISLFLLSFSGSVGATLIDRGNGLIYDTVLNVTWLQDTNLAGHGFQPFSAAHAWVDGLVYQGYDDWRLPTSPGTQQGFVNEGELGHLYYTTLGNVAGSSNPDFGPFLNIPQTNGNFWIDAPPLVAGSAWVFIFTPIFSGFQNAEADNNIGWAWAVRPGDSVSGIPEPGSIMLLEAGLGLLWWARWRRS